MNIQYDSITNGKEGRQVEVAEETGGTSHESVEGIGIITPKAAERFWQKVDSTGGENACWPWNGARDSCGYGGVSINYKNHGAHRISFVLSSGVIPRGLCILHRCDNPPCCNPAHLFTGTHYENTIDKIKKGRAVRQPRIIRKLSDEDVREIRRRRASGENCSSIASSFGIHRITARDLSNFKRRTQIL